jgi:rare lipoprotein A
MRRLFGAALALFFVAGAALAEEPEGPVVYKETGEASWYGPGFHGKETASGETFNQNEMTAAHPKLPLGSEVEVTNLANGKSVTVEINDRGPYAKGRDIDLSKAAADKLDVDGTAPVKIEATEEQIDKAVDKPAEAPKVDAQLDEAKERAEKKEPAELKLVEKKLEKDVAAE